MKNFAIILTLLAAFAVAGCGSSEKSSSVPAKAPASSSTAVTEQTADKATKTASDTPAQQNFKKTELVSQIMKERNVYVVKQYVKNRSLITEYSDGKKSYESDPNSSKITSKDSKLGHFKPAN